MARAGSCFSVLDKSSKDFRLLILQQDLHPDNQLLQCRLETSTLDNPPDYEALSYMWGEPSTFDDKIWVNDVLVTVRLNLLSALHAIRGHGKSERVLWIDALCINQKNPDERNYQVALMEHIYRKAKHVLVWLGAPEKMTTVVKYHTFIYSETRREYYRALRYLTKALDYFDSEKEKRTRMALETMNAEQSRRLKKASAKSLKNPELPDDDGYKAFELLKMAANDIMMFQHKHKGEPSPWEAKFVKDPIFRPHWTALAHLCKVEYWTRLWIIQEIGLARKGGLILLYGSEVCDWDNFRIVRQTLSESSTVHNFILNSNHPISSVLNSFAAQLDIQREDMEDGLTLGSLLELCGTIGGATYCAERRDKVYGLLGLAKDVKIGDIPISYTQSLLDIYLDCIYLKKSDENIARLSYFLQVALGSPLSMDAEPIQMENHPPQYPVLVEPKNKVSGEGFKVHGQSKGAVTTVNLNQALSNVGKQGKLVPYDKLAVPQIGECLSEWQWKEGLEEIWKVEHTVLADSRDRVQFFYVPMSSGQQYIGVASTKIQDADVLFTIPGCPTAAVIRASETSWEVVSRAIICDVSAPAMPPQADTSPKKERYVGYISLEVDAKLLQDLTCPLEKRNISGKK